MAVASEAAKRQCLYRVEWRQNIWNHKHHKTGINRRLGRHSISSGRQL